MAATTISPTLTSGVTHDHNDSSDTRTDLTTDITTSSTVISDNSTLYHIYHVGKEKRPPNYSLHTIKDADTTIYVQPKLTKEEKKAKRQKKKEVKRAKKAEKRALKEAKKAGFGHDALSKDQKASEPHTKSDTPSATIGVTGTEMVQSSPNLELEKKPSIPAKGLKKAGLLDHPMHDPRANTPLPYFLNLPKIGFHAPPYTLHRLGTRQGPVVCLLHPGQLWSGWTMQFGDVLSQPGVIDARGVVSPLYGTADGKDGYLKSYKIGKRRWLAGGGKAFWQAHKASDFSDNARVGELKAKPEEVVSLRWEGLWKGCIREYGFAWRDWKFLWKGTGSAKGVRKAARFFVRWSHLKLVVVVPAQRESAGEGGEQSENVIGEKALPQPPREICLALYTCTMGNRKAGRLEVHEEVMDSFVTDHVLRKSVTNVNEVGNVEVHKGGFVTSSEELTDGLRTESEIKTRQRLKDVIVATSLGMLMIERDKRRFLLELLQEIGENAGG